MGSKILNLGNIIQLNGDFAFGNNDKYYIKFLSVGAGVDIKFLNLIGSGNNAFILCDSVSVDEGTINWKSISTPIINIEFPGHFDTPKSLSINFIDSDDDRIYKALHTWIESTPLMDFKAINPLTLHKFSAEVEFYRYDLKNERSYTRNFTIFPKDLPKYVGTSGGALKTVSCDFLIVDYEKHKYFKENNLLSKLP